MHAPVRNSIIFPGNIEYGNFQFHPSSVHDHKVSRVIWVNFISSTKVAKVITLAMTFTDIFFHILFHVSERKILFLKKSSSASKHGINKRLSRCINSTIRVFLFLMLPLTSWHVSVYLA